MNVKITEQNLLPFGSSIHCLLAQRLLPNCSSGHFSAGNFAAPLRWDIAADSTGHQEETAESVNSAFHPFTISYPSCIRENRNGQFP